MITYYCNVTVPATFRILIESISELDEKVVNQLAINKFVERQGWEGSVWDYDASELRSVIVDEFETPE